MSVGRILALAILLGVASAPTCAGTLAMTQLSYEQNEDRTAFIEQVRKARKGDTEAQWQAGATYVNLGEPARAVPLLQAAAVAGHSRAASLLGWLHETGSGTAKSVDESRRWYLAAAEQGQADAMAALGRLALSEKTPAADEAALPWLQKAAELGNADAQYQLGWLLAGGTSRKPEDAGAYASFLRSARQGHVGAQIAVATHLLAGRGIAADPAAAREWLVRAAGTGDPVAHFLLGRWHEAQQRPGMPEAIDSYLIAARAGHREAQFALADALAAAPDSARRHEAVQWYMKAHDQGHPAAANRLGELYRDGDGDLRQPEKARALFQLAAGRGDANAMYNLAQMQSEGIGGERDAGVALSWFTRAAEQGHDGASAVVERLLDSQVKTATLGLKGFWQ